MSFAVNISQSFSSKMNITRGLAAFAVMFSHLRRQYFVPYADLNITSHNIVNYSLFFISQFGHQAVIVFFVLSGYLVGGAVIKDLISGNSEWLKYFVNRITRMWTVLIPALLLGVILDYITFAINPRTPGTENFTFQSFLGNIFFLQEIRVPTFGTNVPLWSIAFEFWYYLLWPLIIFLIFYRYPTMIKFIFSIILIYSVYLLAPRALLLFPIWVAGALIRLIKDSRFLHKPVFIIFSYILFIGTLCYSSVYRTMTGYYMLGLAVCLLFIEWQYAREYSFHPLINKLAHFFSEFSFSLYAVHYFFIILLLNIVNYYLGIPVMVRDAGIASWSVLFSFALLTYLWAFIFYWFTERHTYTLRSIILNKLTNSTRVQVPKVAEV